MTKNRITKAPLIDFSAYQINEYIPKLNAAIALAKKELDELLGNSNPTFQNTIEALEFVGMEVGELSSIFFNLNSAETNDEMQSIAPEFSRIITEYGNDVSLNPELFQRVKKVWDETDKSLLNAEQNTLLEKTYLSFVRNGALLNEDQKTSLREIDEQLSKTSLTFGENVLAETNAFAMELEEDDLWGLPQSAVDYAYQMGVDAKKEGVYIVNLQHPSLLPFMKYAERRDLREKLYRASSTKACKGNNNDNQQPVLDIAHLRLKRANLLGYDSHADYVLERRMAKSAANVQEFLNDLYEKAKPKAEQDVARVAELAHKDGIDEMMPWDFSFYTEKLKQQELNLDEEKIKPYFELNNCINGVFNVAKILFGYTFQLRTDMPIYHNDVLTYEVFDKEGNHKAYFYADFFPRKGKRPGAWMTSFKGQYKKDGENMRPHISIVCNFSKPAKGKPSLLTFNEVTTLFHEFGHALHGISAEGQYPSLSGTSVFWDFVELPSQVLENWCYEKECLDFFARHFQTQEMIPDAEIEKIIKSQQFMEGYNTMRQLSFGFLDMGWHSLSNATNKNVFEFEQAQLAKTQLLPKIEGTNTSCQFSHIFKGGYASGYYSYKWAEVLDADAFELFKEKGIFDQETAKSFYDNVLSKGGSEHPSILYRRFRGRDPKANALIKRAGL